METKKKLEARLAREGRWAEASRFYAETVAELKKTGINARDRTAEALIRLQEKYPPLLSVMDAKRAAFIRQPGPLVVGDSHSEPQVVPPVPDEEEEPPSNMPVGTGNIDEDVAWAYNHLGADVKPSDAPSGSAWFLREYGRSEKTRDKFVQMAHKTLSKKATTDGEKLRDDRARQFELLSALSREFAGSV